MGAERDANEKIQIIRNLEKAVKILESEKGFAALIPEIRTNIVMALPDASNENDVAGVDGRITIVAGKPTAAGPVKFGVSRHMARVILAMMHFDKTKRAAINIRFSENVLKATRSVAEVKNLVISSFDRADEPSGEKEGTTLDWGVRRAVESSSAIPDIIWDAGAVGKEPVIRIFGRDAVEVAKVVIEIGKKVNG